MPCCSCCRLRESQNANTTKRPAKRAPTREITEYLLSSDLKEDCAICLEPFTTGDRLALLGCGHMFHGPCIYTWLFQKKVCPYCEKPVTL
jgi:E3 ubiquitin-protein ligase RNF115/126